jgi:hypothetical protein
MNRDQADRDATIESMESGSSCDCPRSSSSLETMLKQEQQEAEEEEEVDSSRNALSLIKMASGNNN